MLQGLAVQGNAPKYLAKLNASGIPFRGVVFSSVAVFIIVILNYLFSKSLFPYVMAVATIAAILNWLMIFYTQIKFRQHIGPDKVKDLKFKSPLFPFFNWLGIAYFLLVIAIMFTMDDFRVAVIIAPIWILLIYISYRIKCVRQQKAKAKA